MSLPPIDLAVFHENGYVRKQCRVSTFGFGPPMRSGDTCGDTSEDEYTFIGAPLIAGFDSVEKPSKTLCEKRFLAFSRRLTTPVLTPIRCWLAGVMTFTSPSLPSLIFNRT